MVLDDRSKETRRSWLTHAAILIPLLAIAAPVAARAQPPNAIAPPGAIKPATWPRLLLADPVGRPAAGQARIERQHAVMSFIHKMLHSLGLGEHPPSSAETTRGVFAACRRSR